MKTFPFVPLLVGLLIGASLTHLLLPVFEDTTHPIGYADSAEEVHVHSDFLVYLNGTEYDLTDDKYQSEGTQVLHAHIHLHDNNDEVIHRHEQGVTLADFFNSLGFVFTNDCIKDNTGKEFCSDQENELLVFVNDKRLVKPASYVNQEEDQILIYYGSPADDEIIRKLLLRITDEACIYSGTCPERGIAPAESCGLTCEL